MTPGAAAPLRAPEVVRRAVRAHGEPRPASPFDRLLPGRAPVLERSLPADRSRPAGPSLPAGPSVPADRSLPAGRSVCDERSRFEERWLLEEWDGRAWRLAGLAIGAGERDRFLAGQTAA